MESRGGVKRVQVQSRSISYQHRGEQEEQVGEHKEESQEASAISIEEQQKEHKEESQGASANSMQEQAAKQPILMRSRAEVKGAGRK